MATEQLGVGGAGPELPLNVRKSVKKPPMKPKMAVNKPAKFSVPKVPAAKPPKMKY